jgi:hypothetical protein
MFKLVPDPQFDATVELTVPGADSKAPVVFTFARKGRAALKAWTDSATGRNDLEVLCDVVVGWRGVFDDKGAEVPFSREALAQLLDAYPASGAEVFRGYLQAHFEAARKN